MIAKLQDYIVACLLDRMTFLHACRESWDLSKLPPAVAASVTANRAGWSFQQRLKDAQEGINKATESISASMDGGEPGAGAGNPNGALDPTRVRLG